eukprot:309972-Chlamydomonas_euryale.AAC.1
MQCAGQVEGVCGGLWGGDCRCWSQQGCGGGIAGAGANRAVCGGAAGAGANRAGAFQQVLETTATHTLWLIQMYKQACGIWLASPSPSSLPPPPSSSHSLQTLSQGIPSTAFSQSSLQHLSETALTASDPYHCHTSVGLAVVRTTGYKSHF